MKLFNTFTWVAMAAMTGSALADRNDGVYPDPSGVSAVDSKTQRIKEGVQISELGCMRVYLLFDQEARPYRSRVEQAFSDVDFRLFPADDAELKERYAVDQLNGIGMERMADLVFHAALETREKTALGKLKIFESTATVQLFNVLSGELLATHTSRMSGERHVDEVVARRTAEESALDDAVDQVIEKSLGKAHKVLVHEAQFTGVQTDRQALGIMEYMGKLKGVYHVRQLWFDKDARHLGIEIIGAPHTATFWKAYIDQMSRPGKPATGATKKFVAENDPDKAAPSPQPAQAESSVSLPEPPAEPLIEEVPEDQMTIDQNNQLRDKYADWFPKVEGDWLDK